MIHKPVGDLLLGAQQFQPGPEGLPKGSLKRERCWDRMPQTEAAEVRHNEDKAGSIGASRGTHRFGRPQHSSRPELFSMGAHKSR
jgi:hypothetical protein